MTDPFALSVRGRFESQASNDSDPEAALTSVETMQRHLANLRQTMTAPTSPLSMGERAAASHHVAVIAASLGVLHRALRLVASES